MFFNPKTWVLTTRFWVVGQVFSNAGCLYTEALQRCEWCRCRVRWLLYVDLCNDADVSGWLLQLKACQSLPSPNSAGHPQPPVSRTAVVEPKTFVSSHSGLTNMRTWIRCQCRRCKHLNCKINKKLSYRRGTAPARRAVSVKSVLNVAQMFVELHLISPALSEWPSRLSKIIENSTNSYAILLSHDFTNAER